MNAPLKISKNDAGLAHALGRAQQRSEAELQMERLKGALQNKNRLKSSLNAFGNNVVFSHIEKPYGKRQRWAVAGAVQFSHGILLMMNGIWRGEPFFRPLAAVNNHAISRCLQRTVGRDDRAAVKDALYPHLSVLAEALWKNGPNSITGNVELISRRGILLGDTENGVLTFKTWLDAETASEKRLRDLSAKCGDQVMVVFGGGR